MSRMASNPDFGVEDFEIWIQSLDNDTIVIADEKKPVFSLSHDMAWQQTGSGRIHDSISGHGTGMGEFARLCLALIIKSKSCFQCIHWERAHPGQEPLQGIIDA